MQALSGSIMPFSIIVSRKVIGIFKTALIVKSLLIIGTSCSFAQDTQHNKFQTSKVSNQLSLHPLTCAVMKKDIFCKTELQIEFISSHPQNICVWLSNSSTPKKCYLKTHKFKLSFPIKMKSDVIVFIKDMHGKIIASSELKFAIFQPAKVRKRRGLNWDIF